MLKKQKIKWIPTLLFVCSLTVISSTVFAQSFDRKVKGREYHTLDLISNIDSYNINDERLRMDSAKAHYNMGNIYFFKGEYEIAAREYYQAVTLMPNDPDAHYNLAFISGEHLNDQKTALKHYQMYLSDSSYRSQEDIHPHYLDHRYLKYRKQVQQNK